MGIRLKDRLLKSSMPLFAGLVGSVCLLDAFFLFFITRMVHSTAIRILLFSLLLLVSSYLIWLVLRRFPARSSIPYGVAGPVSEAPPKSMEQTYQKLYEDAQKTENMFRSLIQSSSDPIMIYDMQGRIRSVSPAFTMMFQWTMKESKIIKERFVPSSEMTALRSIFSDLIENRKTNVNQAAKRCTRDGEQREVMISASCFDDHEGNPAGIVMVLRDVTEQNRLEAQLIQSQKMEAIGTLASGIAHDFNNILAAMMGYSEMLLMDLDRDSIQYGYLQQVIDAAMRAKELVRQILTFSRQQEPDRQPMMLDRVVSEALRLLRASLPTTIDIHMNFNTIQGSILADPTQIHQILMNLCTNAAHAMKNKGVLEVGLEDAVIEDNDSTADLQPGRYIKLVIKDTGSGMSRDLTKRIFEPYFTTKEQGEGTGMGLAVVHGIVKSYGGDIRVQSEIGIGSVFEIYFPRMEKDAAITVNLAVAPLPTGNERILLVDDEEILANLEGNMLERLGYQVVTRTSPLEAVEAFKNDADNFDLVITDMTMPQMTGDILAREIMKIRPDVPVILCTGYNEQMTEETVAASGIRDVFAKPFVLKELAGTIRTILDVS